MGPKLGDLNTFSKPVFVSSRLNRGTLLYYNLTSNHLLN